MTNVSGSRLFCSTPDFDYDFYQKRVQEGLIFEFDVTSFGVDFLFYLIVDSVIPAVSGICDT